MIPVNMPSLTEKLTFVMLTFSCDEMIFVISFIRPILSIPLRFILARNDTSLSIAHFTAMILVPSFDISLIATGHLGLCITIGPSGEWYPTTSSPGIGLQHAAI